jgi:putative redox protein
MSASEPRHVRTTESGQGPYGQFITARNHVLSADEPEAAGGRDSGPDPFELVMSGLAACTAMTIRMYAQRKAWPLARVTVDVTHAPSSGPDGQPRDRFDRLVTLEGDLSLEERARLIEIADRCPVSLTLKRGSDVTVTERGTTEMTATG